MCFNPLSMFGSQPSAPPIPRPVETPQIDNDAVRRREQREAELLASQSGTASTVRTDLDPSSLQGSRRVLLGV